MTLDSEVNKKQMAAAAAAAEDVGDLDGETIPLKCQTTETPTPSNEKTTGSNFIYLLAFFSCIGGFLFGYDTGVISGAMLIINEEMELDTWWHQAIVSSTILAAWLFALIGGFLSDSVGRKPVILASSVVFIAGSITMGAANDQMALLVGRVIVGIGIGMVSMALPLYLAEVAHKQMRGLLVTMNTMLITGGQATAAITTGILANSAHNWRYMLGIAAIPAAIQCVGFFFMPESPRWLVSKGRVEEARKVLQSIRGRFYDIDEEMESILTSEEETQREKQLRSERGQSSWILLQILQTPTVRRALLLGCLLQMFQQIAGINTVMYYSATIIQMAGFYDTTQAIWLSALVASVNFVCTFIGVFLVERVGRRRLTLVSLLGVVIALAFLAGGFHIVDSNTYAVTNPEEERCGLQGVLTCNECMVNDYCGFCFRDGSMEGSCIETHATNYSSGAEFGPCSAAASDFDGEDQDRDGYVWAWGWCPTKHGWITVVGLIFYLLFFAPGMGPMPWTINSEIYPLWARSTCNSIAASVNWFFNFCVSVSFLTSVEFLGRSGVFFQYCMFALVGFLLFCWLLPETKGQTLEDVELLFSRSPCPSLPFFRRRDSVNPNSAKSVQAEDQQMTQEVSKC